MEEKADVDVKTSSLSAQDIIGKVGSAHVAEVSAFECHVRRKSALLQELWLSGLAKEGQCTVKVVGTSMAPLIEIGDTVVVGRVEDPRTTRCGDIVLLNFDDTWVVHRIIAKSKKGGQLCFRQKGDAGLISGLAKPDQIVGKVMAIKKEDRVIDLNRLVGKSINLALAMPLVIIERLYRTAGKIKKFLFPDGSDRWIQPVAEFAKRVFWKAQKVVLRLVLRVRIDCQKE